MFKYPKKSRLEKKLAKQERWLSPLGKFTLENTSKKISDGLESLQGLFFTSWLVLIGNFSYLKNALTHPQTLTSRTTPPDNAYNFFSNTQQYFFMVNQAVSILVWMIAVFRYWKASNKNLSNTSNLFQRTFFVTVNTLLTFSAFVLFPTLSTVFVGIMMLMDPFVNFAKAGYYLYKLIRCKENQKPYFYAKVKDNIKGVVITGITSIIFTGLMMIPGVPKAACIGAAVIGIGFSLYPIVKNYFPVVKNKVQKIFRLLSGSKKQVSEEERAKKKLQLDIKEFAKEKYVHAPLKKYNKRVLIEKGEKKYRASLVADEIRKSKGKAKAVAEGIKKTLTSLPEETSIKYTRQNKENFPEIIKEITQQTIHQNDLSGLLESSIDDIEDEDLIAKVREKVAEKIAADENLSALIAPKPEPVLPQIIGKFHEHNAVILKKDVELSALKKEIKMHIGKLNGKLSAAKENTAKNIFFSEEGKRYNKINALVFLYQLLQDIKSPENFEEMLNLNYRQLKKGNILKEWPSDIDSHKGEYIFFQEGYTDKINLNYITLDGKIEKLKVQNFDEEEFQALETDLLKKQTLWSVINKNSDHSQHELLKKIMAEMTHQIKENYPLAFQSFFKDISHTEILVRKVAVYILGRLTPGACTDAASSSSQPTTQVATGAALHGIGGME